MMKLNWIAYFVLPMFMLNPAAAQENCTPVEAEPGGSIWITAKDITQSGKYCLIKDIKAPKVSSFALGGERYYKGDMLIIAASDVLFDLQGFTVNVESSGMGGIRSIRRWIDSSGSGELKPPKERLINPPQRRITIRNGTIKSKTQSSIFFAELFGNRMMSLRSDDPDYIDSRRKELAEYGFQSARKGQPATANEYIPTEHIIEHMRVDSSASSPGAYRLRVAIGMKGASNIIRNSTIVVADGHAAIYLFGPNQIIENNIIIFKGKAAVESATAIKLHQADGSIIRNNDIIIDSPENASPKAAISLIDSKNVVVQGNRIYGIKRLVHAWDEQSTAIDQNNDFKSLLLRPWSLGQRGVQ